MLGPIQAIGVGLGVVFIGFALLAAFDLAEKRPNESQATCRCGQCVLFIRCQ